MPRAKLSSQHPLSREPDPSNLVPLSPFPSSSERDVVVSLLENAGIRVYYDPPHQRESQHPQLYVTRQTFEEANRVIERARWQSHLVPVPASARDGRSTAGVMDRAVALRDIECSCWREVARDFSIPTAKGPPAPWARRTLVYARRKRA